MYDEHNYYNDHSQTMHDIIRQLKFATQLPTVTTHWTNTAMGIIQKITWGDKILMMYNTPKLFLIFFFKRREEIF